jgi:ribosomal protein S18 acetylase RimI-like enzyme
LRGSFICVLGRQALLGRADAAKRIHWGANALSTASIPSHHPAKPTAICVRFATPKDVTRLFKLKRQMAMLDGTIRAMRATVDDWLRDSSGPHRQFAALVAEDGPAIIGMLTFSTHHYSGMPEPALCIQDLFVQPDCRGRDMASALLEELLAHARKYRVCHVELSIRNRNNLAQTMSRRLGFARVDHCATYHLGGRSLLRLAEGAGDIAALPS